MCIQLDKALVPAVQVVPKSAVVRLSVGCLQLICLRSTYIGAICPLHCNIISVIVPGGFDRNKLQLLRQICLLLNFIRTMINALQR